MYKNLNVSSLGISARQNELIEFALTYKFDSFDLDIENFIRQLESRDLNYAKRFIDSANIRIGTFDLPVRWEGDVADFKSDLAKLDSIGLAISTIGATRCRTVVPYHNDQAPYHEFFEMIRMRFTEVAEVLDNHGIRLGVGFLGAAYHAEADSEPFITTPQALTTLVKTISAANVGISLDLWDWHVAGGTVAQIRELAPTQITDVRIADVPLNADLASVTEKDRLLPGSTGVVPTVEIIDYLKSEGYEGPISVICHESQLEPRNKNLAVERVANSLAEVLSPSFNEDGEDVSENSVETVGTAS